MKKGFTIVEALVVIAVIGALFGLIFLISWSDAESSDKREQEFKNCLMMVTNVENHTHTTSIHINDTGYKWCWDLTQ